MADFNNGAEFLRPDEHDGMPILFWDLPSPKPFRPCFDRPARKSKRWVPIIKVRWVYSERGEHYPYGKEYWAGEKLVEVELPADRPQVRWDR
jgi:hypothetical protein